MAMPNKDKLYRDNIYFKEHWDKSNDYSNGLETDMGHIADLLQEAAALVNKIDDHEDNKQIKEMLTDVAKKQNKVYIVKGFHQLEEYSKKGGDASKGFIHFTVMDATGRSFHVYVDTEMKNPRNYADVWAISDVIRPRYRILKNIAWAKVDNE